MRIESGYGQTPSSSGPDFAHGVLFDSSRGEERCELPWLDAASLDREPVRSRFPEHLQRLSLAIIEDAYRFLQRKRRPTRDLVECLTWIRKEGYDAPYSFDMVCHVLGWPETKARARFLALAESRTPPPRLRVVRTGVPRAPLVPLEVAEWLELTA